MARTRGTGFYSRVVSWLKVVLPLVALGLLSTIFLFARNSDPTSDLPIATARSLADRASEMVTRPSYSGATSSGALLTLSAESARPAEDDADNVAAEGITAAMTWEDGRRIDLSAPVGRIDEARGAARLSGGVRLRSSIGYVMETDALDAAMDRIDIVSDGPVRAEGPAGTLEAGAMRIEETDPDTGAVRLLFTDGVEMVYRP